MKKSRHTLFLPISLDASFHSTPGAVIVVPLVRARPGFSRDRRVEPFQGNGRLDVLVVRLKSGGDC
jgi:hypothetical protein